MLLRSPGGAVGDMGLRGKWEMGGQGSWGWTGGRQLDTGLHVIGRAGRC